MRRTQLDQVIGALDVLHQQIRFNRRLVKCRQERAKLDEAEDATAKALALLTQLRDKNRKVA